MWWLNNKVAEQSQNKENKKNGTSSNLFDLLNEDKLEEFNREISRASLDNLNILKDNRTLLIIAVEKGYEDIVKSLIQKDVNINKENNELETALYFAFKSNNKNIQKLLLDNNAILTSKILELNLEDEFKKSINEKIEKT